MIPLYFDPGTGALIIQFLAAFVAGVLMFYKTIILKIKTFFGVKVQKEDAFLDDIDTKEDNS